MQQTNYLLSDLILDSHQGINTVTEKVRYAESGTPIIQAKHITSGSIVLEDVRYIDEVHSLKYQEKYNPQIGNILLSNIGTIGICAYVAKRIDFLIAWNVYIIKPDVQKVHSKYLFYYIQSNALKGFFEKYSTGNATKFVNKGDILRMKLSLVDKAKQTLIANTFSSVDEKINLLTKKKEALETYKKGLMQKIFSQELRFKRDDGTDYPEWEENEIGQIFKEIRDKVGDSVVETFSITAGKGFVSQAEKFGRDISGSQNPNYIRLKPNQYSYNKGNSKTFKYGCVYRNLIGKDIAVPNVFISLDLLNGDYRYFDTLFESHFLDRHLRRIISSSARMDGLLNIPKRDFFLIPLPVPCLEEQAKIGQTMHQLDKSIGVIERQLQNVISLKKGLLQQMFV